MPPNPIYLLSDCTYYALGPQNATVSFIFKYMAFYK